MIISHNISAMNSNRQARMVGRALSKSSEKLSSGYRINRAADDAAGLSISEKMRKQIRGLTQGVLNAEDGISLCQVADGALSEVHDMLQRLNELAVKAANGTNSESDRRNINDEVSQLLTEIDRIGDTTKFNEAYIFKGIERQITEETQIIYSGGTGGAAPKPQIVPTPTFDQMDMDCELTAGPFGRYDRGNTLKLAAKSTKAETPYTWNLIYGSGNTSYPKLMGEYTFNTPAGTASTHAFTMDLREVTPTSYSASVVNGENTWARTFEYTDEPNKVRLQMTQTVTMHEKKGNESQYYTIHYEVKNTSSSCSIKYDLVHHEDTAYNNNDRVESYYLSDGKRVNKSSMYTTTTSYSSINNPNVYVTTSLPGNFSIINEQAALSFSESIVLDGGDGAKQADTLIVGQYYSVGQLKQYTTASMSAVLGQTTTNMDLGFSLVWSDESLAANGGKQTYSFRQGIVNVDEDKNIPPTIIKVPTVDITPPIESRSILIRKDIMGGMRQLWIQSGCDVGDGLICRVEAMNTGVLDIKDISVFTESQADDAITRISGAIAHLSKQRSRYGAYQNRLEHTIANEDSIVENTTAAESQIRDTDMAKEIVFFTNQNILRQAGSAMLAQANQINNGVLSLLSS